MTACPQLESYAALAAGAAPPVEVETLLAHLETCADCAQRVETLGQSNTLLDEIRRADVDTHSSGEVVVQQIIAQACATSDSQATAPAADLALELLAPPELAGEMGRLGGYRVLRVLGAGGMGVVFEAEDTQLKRRVALKGIRPALAASAEARRRFLREAQAVAALKHDHVVTIYQVGEDRGVPYLAMEYLEGESLSDCLEREGKLDTTQVVRIGFEVAEGLNAAHGKGLVHRDIKPANIWLESVVRSQWSVAIGNQGAATRATDHGPRTAGYRVKILDFGLACGGDDDTHITDHGVIVGTPAYMSPEQTRGEELDFHADLFSLGCVLYLMCTGQAPFAGKDSMSTLLAVATHQPLPPRQVNAQVPAALSDLIMRLLNKDSAKRPASAQEVAAALRQIATAPPPAVAVRRPRWFVPAAAAVLLALLPLGYFFGGTVIRFATNKGEVIIETDDPDIVVTITQGKAELHDKVKDRRFVLEAGEYELKVTEKDGALFGTKHFQLTRGGKVIVNARLELAKARPKDGGKIKLARGDPDRRAAEYVLSVGGHVHIDGQTRVITTADRLPRDAFLLTGFKIFNKEVTEEGMAVFKDCKNLTSVSFSDTRGVTIAALANFQHCDNLISLGLGGINVGNEGVAHFKGCKNLKSLTLWGVDVGDEGLAHFHGCVGLTNLFVHGPRITDKSLVLFKGHKQLTYLDVKKTNVTKKGIEEFAKAQPQSKIEWDGPTIEPTVLADPDRRAAEWALACGGNIVIRTVNGAHPKIAAAKDLPKDRFTLVRVLLGGCGDRVTDEGLDNLEGLRHLTHLYLNKTAVTDAGLDRVGQLTTLVDLFLPDTNITDAGLSKLKGLSALKQLSVYRTKVTDAGLAHVATLRELEIVDLNDVPITDDGLALLVKLPKLKNLGLAGTKITDRGLALLAGMPQVTTLDLGYTPVTDAGMEHLKKRTQLERLNISRSQVTETGVASLKNLPALWEIGLSERQATDAGLDSLRSLPKLATLKMVVAQLNDAHLERLRALPALTELHVMMSGISPALEEKLRKALPKCNVVVVR